MTVSRSGRRGMNCKVNARPASFRFGCRTRKSPAYWLRKPSLGSTAKTSSAESPRARWISASGILGRPSGKRSKGFWAVSSIIWSLETVKICAWAAVGIIAAAAKRERQRTVEGFIVASFPMDDRSPRRSFSFRNENVSLLTRKKSPAGSATVHLELDGAPHAAPAEHGPDDGLAHAQDLDVEGGAGGDGEAGRIADYRHGR